MFAERSLRCITTTVILLVFVTIKDTQQLDGPVIINPSSNEIILQSGQNYTLECKGTKPLEFKQQDIPEDPTGDFIMKERFMTSYNESEFRVALDLINVDRYAVGYYACFDNTLNSSEVLRNVIDEPNNTAHVSYVYVYVNGQKAEAPMPTIYSGEQFFMDGDDFSINCTVPRRDIAVELSWKVPGPRTKVRNVSNAYEINGKDNLYNNITVINASSEDKGKYTCITQTSYGTKNSTIEKKYLENAFLEVRKANNDKVLIHTMSRVVQLKIEIKSYPPANVTTIYKDDPKRVIVPDGKKYVVMIVKRNFYLKITELTPSDTGKYTFIVSNGHLTKNVSYDFRYPGPPKVQFGQPDMPLKYIKNVVASLKCEAIGYPVPQIKWEFEHDGTTSEIKNHQTDKKIFMYQQISILQFNVTKSGRITCRAINENGTDFVTRRFLVYEIENGFGVENLDKLWFPEGRTVEIKCLASLYDFNNVSWSAEDGKEFYVQDADTTDSIVSLLRIENIGVEQAGDYTCSGLRNNGSVETQTITVTVAKTHAPLVISPKDETHEVVPFQPVSISCTADAVPPPVIEWTKDDILLANTSDIEIKTVRQNLTMINSTIYINKMKEELTGSYQCLVISGTTPAYKHYNIFMTDKSPHKTMYLSVAGVIFFVLILLVAYLTWKIRKEKQFRKELAAAGLLYFKEGVTKSLNPDLGIDEQAELLPYDDKFEFPIEKLTLGKQLGAGAFGVVYKAEARGIINAEQSTTVAVKMVKKTADNMYIKALASELKIMVHLGRHINIVNLLGACTKNVGKRELAVIVEYCKFGNIHNYLQKHREVFINQLTDNFDKNLGKVNRGYSCSSANSGMHSDYFGSNHTQETDHTFVNTANTNRSGVKVSQSGYLMQPEWRSNYESDYSFDGRSPRPLCSRDLLAWSFQIARGMEYLASRKIVHGDLAARNILLAEDNVVKICDFGLARSIYKNDEYQKKENSLLPVKWLAIECMTDRIFSTQSDVWSFGIVLWELFTLAKTPYPNISPPSLLQFLSEGHRLEKPPYADDKLYDVMRRCWAQKPTARPGFSQLQEIMGSFLEDNVRNHYVDLNATNVKSNMKQAGEEDYLAMVCAPDYNNLVTPSPHHYVNDARRFFPSTPNQIQQDDEGYLEMSPASRQSIFHARTQGTKFDFEARNLNPRVSEANSYGSESTPMLTLNNLPRSGSESDQEGNPSPYLNMHPKIEEETDDVFNTNEINSKNVNPSAVTNPTYITLNDEKKQQNFANNYINVPNGLVK